MVADKNLFALELNEKEVMEILENTTQESMKKATKYGMKIFQGKNLPKLSIISYPMCTHGIIIIVK